MTHSGRHTLKTWPDAIDCAACSPSVMLRLRVLSWLRLTTHDWSMISSG